MKQYGVDVSHHQNPTLLPWSRFAESSSFAIVRGSYGTMKDRVTAEHVRRARAVGLKVGLYHFFRPSQLVRHQLATFRAQLELAQIGVGDIVPTIDVEADPMPKPGTHVSPAWQGSVLEFIDAMVSELGDCMVYITQREFGMLGAPEWLLTFPLWVAHYTQAAKPATPGNRPWTLWQHRVGPYVPLGPGGYDKANPLLDQNHAVELPLVESLSLEPVAQPAPTDEDDAGLEEAILAHNQALFDEFVRDEYSRVTEERPGAGRALLEYEQAGLVDEPTHRDTDVSDLAPESGRRT